MTIQTTNPNQEKVTGVELLARHFETHKTISPASALERYGIGRLSARVFDLNRHFEEKCLPKRIRCVKKTITKRNGSKARVTDYYIIEDK